MNVFEERSQWLDDVGDLTSEHRECRAELHGQKAQRSESLSALVLRLLQELSLSLSTHRDVVYSLGSAGVKLVEIPSGMHPRAVSDFNELLFLFGLEQGLSRDALQKAVDGFLHRLTSESVAQADDGLLRALLLRASDRFQRSKEWHKERAKGQVARIQNVQGCHKTKVLVTTCGGCGCVEERPASCSIGMLCWACRSKRNAKLRVKFLKARRVVTGEVLAWNRKHPGHSPMNERFLTLTVPHCLRSVGERLELLTTAHGFFLRMLNERWRGEDNLWDMKLKQKWNERLDAREAEELAWQDWCRARDDWEFRGKPYGERPERPLKPITDRDAEAWEFRRQLVAVRRDGQTKTKKKTLFGSDISDVAHYYRVIEVTEGSDNLGHPHIHLWLVSDYLEREWVQLVWREALQRAGHEWKNDDEMPIVDIRSANKGDGLAQELIKYLTKDVIGTKKTQNGRVVLMPPDVFAEIYKAFDGKRRTQGSKGFLAKAGIQRAKCECGAEGCFEVRFIKDPEQVESALKRCADAAADRARQRAQKMAA